MILKWEIERHDVKKVVTFFNKWADDPFVKLRKRRNIDIPRPIISREGTWMALVGCLLTTQQRSGPGSAVKRILDENPFPLNYTECSKKRNLEGFAKEILNSFGGVRRIPTISKQIASNYKKLENGLWQTLLSAAEQINISAESSLEREASHMLAKHLDGIGPKQSCNLLQWIGVSKYEIPIDSRITKWLNQNLLKFHLSANLLADPIYYDMVSDGIQLLCKRCNMLPCMFDAAIFTSFDGGWSESDIRVRNYWRAPNDQPVV
jgi:thermostable 8-oxoguanine DNA glycosylase